LSASRDTRGNIFTLTRDVRTSKSNKFVLP
jgi:hypothetical protein